MPSNNSDSPASSGNAPHEVRDEVARDARRLAEAARGRVEQEADRRREQVSHTAHSASSAVSSAADDLEQREDAPDWLVSAFRQTARQIEKFAGSMEGMSAREFGQQVSDFARRRPGAFLAASAAAGFIAARVLRAGVEHEEAAQSGIDSDQSTAFVDQEGPAAGSQAGAMGGPA